MTMSTIKSNNILKDLTDILNYSDLIYSKDCSDYFKEVTADTLEKFENLFYDKITNQIKSEQFTLYFKKLIDFIDDIDFYIGYEAILNCISPSHSMQTITYDNMFVLRDQAIEIHRVFSNEYSDRIDKKLLDQTISSPPLKIDHETFLKYSIQFEEASNNGDESIQLGGYNINVKDHGVSTESAKMIDKFTEEVRGGPFDPNNGKEPITNLIGIIIHYRIKNHKK